MPDTILEVAVEGTVRTARVIDGWIPGCQIGEIETPNCGRDRTVGDAADVELQCGSVQVGRAGRVGAWSEG